MPGLWHESLQADVRALAVGWSIKERKGKAFLRVRLPEQREAAVTLPFEWTQSNRGDINARVRNIFALAQKGYTLRQAAEVAAGKAPKPIEKLDWQGALERFKEQKIRHGNTIAPATWESKYNPVLADAINHLTGLDQPTSPAELVDRCIRKWEPGSRTRQERARNLCQFLRHCISREQMPVIWQPPIDLKEHIGRKPASASSQKADPITDEQVITLLASLPDDEAGMRWTDAIKLITELGLRPVELLFLHVKKDLKTKEHYWWCSYEKRTGGGVTKPRRLFPLPLIDDVKHAEWDLLNRWKNKKIHLPSLASGNGAADAIATYLNRRDGWKTLKAEAEAMGEHVTSYSFRHAYSVRGHQRGIDNGSMALAMGHSIEVHCRSYPWATEAGAAAAFDKAGSKQTISHHCGD
jgi:integrase